MPNFRLLKYLRLVALILFIADLALNLVLSKGIGIIYLLILAVLQGLAISFMTRYGNYFNEDDYPKIVSGEWKGILDLKGIIYGIYCLFVGIWKLFVSYSLYLFYSNIDELGDTSDKFIFFTYSIVAAIFGIIVIVFVILTFIFLRDRNVRYEDSQILDKDL